MLSLICIKILCSVHILQIRHFEGDLFELKQYLFVEEISRFENSKMALFRKKTTISNRIRLSLK